MEYIDHLKKDKKLATILNETLPPLQLRLNIPLRLMASIMGQQLSIKVAKVIYRRFLEIYNGEEPKPQQVVDTPFEVLRAIGLSNAKVSYVQNVALFSIENNITDTILLSMANEEIIDLLTRIKGVGKWTVEMLLMFTLARQDVFSVDDLGIQQAMILEKALLKQILSILDNFISVFPLQRLVTRCVTNQIKQILCKKVTHCVANYHGHTIAFY